MDSKGIATIDFLFTMFLSLVLAIAILNLIGANFNSEKNIESDMTGRLILERVANTINQVNSNLPGTSQELDLPKNISGNSYVLTMNSNYVILEYDNKKGRSAIFPVNLVNFNGESIKEVKLYGGMTYKIKKSLNEDNVSVVNVFTL